MIAHARTRVAFDPSRRRYSSIGSSRRDPVGNCRIGSVKASTADFESRPAACSQSANLGSSNRLLLFSTCKADAVGSCSHCAEAFNLVELSPSIGQAKVLVLVFAKAKDAARTQRSRRRPHSRRR